jgi:hypothetical protein
VQQVTLGQMLTGSLQYSDMLGLSDSDQFITRQQAVANINASLAEFQELLIRNDVKYFLTSSIFQLNQGQNTFPLPSQVTPNNTGNGSTSLPVDFAVSMGLDRSLDGSGSPGTWFTVQRNSWRERNRGNNAYWLALPQATARYDIVGNNVMFFPPQLASGLYQLWWYPSAPVLVNDSDWVDGAFFRTEYVIVDANIKFLIQEESLDTAQLWMARKNELAARIETMASDRDYSTPLQAGSMEGDQGGGRYGPFGC